MRLAIATAAIGSVSLATAVATTRVDHRLSVVCFWVSAGCFAFSVVLLVARLIQAQQARFSPQMIAATLYKQWRKIPADVRSDYMQTCFRLGPDDPAVDDLREKYKDVKRFEEFSASVDRLKRVLGDRIGKLDKHDWRSLPLDMQTEYMDACSKYGPDDAKVVALREKYRDFPNFASFAASIDRLKRKVGGSGIDWPATEEPPVK